ncbi:MAG TPA: GspE/PulE family protein [Candidatus Paceibacterota bacterium]|nr:GspE/PulE family protein [Candidatus Paceibacterota bacterium]
MKIIHDYKTATEAVENILEKAVSLSASDVHIDPTEDHIRIRLRIDGEMEDGGVIPKSLHQELIARLKIMSGARTDIHTVPQDGRWRSDISGATYNIRISFMPTYHGENAVIRLLPARRDTETSFAQLGFIPDHVQLVDTALKKTHGLILVTGPTGSGKTTTLHSCLALKASEPISVITLEDPVEYEIPGVRQVHIHHTHGVTFATGLRAALRQDPDVIMVGEIRDHETAEVAIHTALTGHLVLSTLHTNSALEAIPRLIDMGVDPYLLASTLSLVIAQRLVRKICELCDANGCDECRGTGYKGRSVIIEAYEPDQGMKDLIARREPVSAYVEYARSRGFRTMLDDGMEKVEWGVTSQAEIIGALLS